jgi:hypothetical protein
MQELLDVVAAWGPRRNIKFSPKSFAATLSEQGSTEEEKPPLHVGDVPMSWQPPDAPFRYLGVTTHCTAIEQVVYAGALYDAAIMDTDYEKLDSLTLAAVRRTLQIPPRTSTAFLRWELRLPPSRLRAHKRALRWAHQLWHGSWIGQEIMNPYLLDNTSRQQADEIHPIFEMGPVGRLTRILKEYGLTWAAILVKNQDEKSKDESKDEKREKKPDASQKPTDEKAKVSHDCTCAAFLPWIRQKLEDTVGIPATHKKELAVHMRIDEGEYSWAGQLNPQDIPLYLFIDGPRPCRPMGTHALSPSAAPWGQIPSRALRLVRRPVGGVRLPPDAVPENAPTPPPPPRRRAYGYRRGGGGSGAKGLER